ncbi:MAG: hypothetical protein PHO02_02485 [Candidatus Nanoarchaeia archaeon]|nr:hypothetical protein [Candidatus Nanoarchaeia archaeon]
MEEQVSEESKSTFHEIRKDKILLVIFIAVILLGITVRFIYPTEPGLWNDDMSTLPTGLLWFYPHEYYPGLSAEGEPALGAFMFGAGCMLSGEDFSAVTKIKPMWYPDRPMLFGKELIKAEDYCRISSYFFGLLLFLALILLSLSLLDQYSALFSISFFAFYSHILQLSRWIHEDIVEYTFIAFGLLFLWKFFSSEKYGAKELFLFIFSMIFFALAFGTKIPAAAFLLFAIAMLLIKYKREVGYILKRLEIWLGFKISDKLKETTINLRRLALMIFTGLTVYILTLLLPFEFNLRNILLVIQKYRSVDVMQGSAFGSLSLNTNFWGAIHNFLLSLNIMDIILLLVSIFVLVMLFLLKKKEVNEWFITSLVVFFIAVLAIFPSMVLLRVFIAFFWGIPLIMGLVISKSAYSPLNLLNLKEKTKRLVLILILLSYISVASYTAFLNAPYFEYRNPLICDEQECLISYSFFADSQLGVFLQGILKDNSTTFESFAVYGMVYYYIRPEEGQEMLFLRESLRQQIGRMPTLRERIMYFKPLGRTIQYIPFDPNKDYNDEFIMELKHKYVPNYKVILKHGFEAYWIYDLQNLTKL